MRPSHDTREQTVARLRQGYVAGRIGTETFALRIDHALQSESQDELRGLTADLPAQRAAFLARLRARLRRRGLGLPEAHDLLRATLLIGRSSACQLVLADDTVSRRHAELRAEGGRWLLRDLGSSNGTYLNGRRVIEAEVRPGDLLHLGGAEIRL
jgi:pSer/pThr/pTyr-binding forkhead associated (FHA) protein